MSRFNNTDYQDLIDQIETLDSKVVNIIQIMKELQERVTCLEKIAKKHGIPVKSRDKKMQNDESCVVM